MYIKKKDRELFELIDNSLVMPSDFERFITKCKINQNLIIKRKNIYRCTNCNNVFISNEKINQLCKCPKCKNYYKVKMCNLKKYTFREDLAIFDKVDKYYVERIFELRSDFDGNSFKTKYFEWGRKIYDENFDLIHEIMNDNTIGTTGGYFVSYRAGILDNHWKKSNSWCSPISYADEFTYYPGNIKSIIGRMKQYKYSMIWDLLENITIKCDLIYLLKNYDYCIEILTKMKLYNLALCPKTFRNKKTFEERFLGLTKDYLPFIQKYNLTISELEALSLVKEKDIELIKLASEITNLKTLNEYINIKKAFKLTDLNTDNCSEYSDYLNMLVTMQVSLKDKAIAYPKNIKKAHDEVLEQFETRKDKYIKNAIETKSKKLGKFIFKDSKFIIFPAKSMEMLEDESSQQNNCVRTYGEKIAKGECDIYFMRLITNKNKSLVTVEVKDNKVVQQRTKNNQDTTKEQKRFLANWENKILKG